MKDEIVKIIAEYLESNNLDSFQKIHANRIHSKFTQGQIDYYKSPPNQWPDDCVALTSRREDIKFHDNETKQIIDQIAAEIAEKLLPIVNEKGFPYNELFDHMANEHGLAMTNTELGDIIHIARGGEQKTETQAVPQLDDPRWATASFATIGCNCYGLDPNGAIGNGVLRYSPIGYFYIEQGRGFEFGVSKVIVIENGK
jgi:hypothetical protein